LGRHGRTHHSRPNHGFLRGGRLVRRPGTGHCRRGPSGAHGNAGIPQSGRTARRSGARALHGNG
jgi:hypothetical protein